MANVRLSKKFTLQVPDVIRGALMAVGAALLTAIQQSLQNDEITLSWKYMATTALSTLVVYLVKNGVFEPAKVITTASSNLKAENAAEKINEVVTKP